MIQQESKSYLPHTETLPRQDRSFTAWPAYKWKAWRHLEVCVLAFVVAIWQLGAIAAYMIQQYCALLKMCFDMLVFLRLVENTSLNCFRELASSASTLVIIFLAVFGVASLPLVGGR
jgi:hypothetical protein